MATAERLFMLGYDGMNYQLLRRFLNEGCLPTFQSLLSRGSLNRLLCAIPAWTPTNWSTLVTGASAGGHRTGSWSVRESNDPAVESTLRIRPRTLQAAVRTRIGGKAVPVRSVEAAPTGQCRRGKTESRRGPSRPQ